MNNVKATPLMKQACAQAEAVLHLALDAVDSVLHEDGVAIENQQLVAAYMNVAGAAYTALTIRDAIDHFIESQEETRGANALARRRALAGLPN